MSARQHPFCSSRIDFEMCLYLGERESFIGDESKFWLNAGLIKKLYSDAHPYTHTHIRLNYT